MTTKPRMLRCKNIDCPHEKVMFFSDWVRENCPCSSTGFLVTDIDFILISQQSKSIMLLEVKTKDKSIEPWQRNILNVFHKIISYGLPMVKSDMVYLGMHSVRFSNTDFTNGECYLDGNIITESELRDLLNF